VEIIGIREMAGKRGRCGLYGDGAVSPGMMVFSRVIAQERLRRMPFLGALEGIRRHLTACLNARRGRRNPRCLYSGVAGA
jgi:hypothetical protein